MISHQLCSSSLVNPYPSRGGGRGRTKPTGRIPLFLLGNPGIVTQTLKWNCKVTFLNKPCALVRKYLRLAPEQLSASMMTAGQFLEGCHPYTCAASVWHVLSGGAKHKYLIFICLPMTWNDEEYWSLRKHDCKNGILKSNFSTTPPPSNSIFKRVGILITMKNYPSKRPQTVRS